MNRYWLCVNSMLLVWIAAASSARADSSQLPVYQAEPCCQLCPDALADTPASGLQEGRDGWLFPAPSRPVTALLKQSERFRLMSLFVRQMAAKGSHIMLVMTPPRTLIYAERQQNQSANAVTLNEYRQTLAGFRRAGFLVPAYDNLRQPETGAAGESFFFKRDLRWTSAGARQTAQMVATEIRKLPLFQQLPEQRFVTRPQGWLKINGALNHQSQTLCGGQRYPVEYTPHFMTKAVSINSGTSAAMEEDILLIGSSQSVDNGFNFNGFLQQELARNVVNHTAADGDSSVAWMNLLMSASYQQNPAALILWEMPYEHSALSTSMLRQLIALADNGCESRAVLGQTVQTFQGHKLEDLVFSERLLQQRPGELIFDMTFSDPAIKQLQLTVWYSDGGKSDFEINRTGQIHDNGRFSFVLGNADDLQQQRFFVSLDLMLPEAARGKTSVTTRVCRAQVKPLQTAGR